MLNNVPQSSQSLGQTQALIQQNFSTIDTAFSVNHVQYNDGSGDQGKHKWITFPLLSVPAPIFGAGEVGLYDQIPLAPNVLTGQPELFLRKSSFAGAVTFPMTASILSTSTPVALSSGWTYLPSGLILKWAANVSCTGSQTVSFPTGANIPVFNTCITVIPQIAQGGGSDTNTAVRLTAVGATNFTVYVSPRTTTGTATSNITYFAIGY
jgi:hypothetical protein